MIAESSTSVPLYMSDNERIRQKTEQNIAYYASGGIDAINRRIHELDNEWDVERVLEANTASMIITGSLFTLLSGKRWLMLPLAASGILLQHAIRGGGIGATLLRKMGVRTRREIEQERNALKSLRGDFEGMPKLTANCREEAERILATQLK
jgi:hypothetical protein